MTTIADISKITDKEEAFQLINEQDWKTKKKAQARYAWKLKNDKSSIDRCPEKGISKVNKVKNINNKTLLQNMRKECLQRIERYKERIKQIDSKLEKMV